MRLSRPIRAAVGVWPAYEPTGQPLSLFAILGAKPHEAASPERSWRPAADRLDVHNGSKADVGPNLGDLPDPLLGPFAEPDRHGQLAALEMLDDAQIIGAAAAMLAPRNAWPVLMRNVLEDLAKSGALLVEGERITAPHASV